MISESPTPKPLTKNGTSHFKGHAVISEKKTRDILKRLKFDNNTINEVSKLVLIHDMKSPRDKNSGKKNDVQSRRRSIP